MGIRKALVSLLFTLLLVLPLGLWVYNNRTPEPVAPPGLIVEDRVIDAPAPFYREGERLFLSTGVLDSLGIPFTVDPAAKLLLIPVQAGRAAFEDPAVTRQVTGEAGTLNFPLKYLNTGAYVELERLDAWLGLSAALTPDQGTLLLDPPGERIQGRVIAGGAALYPTAGSQGSLQRRLEEGEKVRLFSLAGNQYRLRTADGLIGYAPQDAILPYPEPAEPAVPFTAVRRTPGQYGPIQITFEYVGGYSSAPDLSGEAKITGLDVLCPTWFTLDEAGTVQNEASIRYVRDAHRLGYRVWGVLRNGFEPERTHLMLSSEALRAQAVAAVAFYCAFYELDGINVDFENVYKKDQARLTVFLEALDAVLTRQGVTLSVDAAPPWGSDEWSLFLDRAQAGRVADYVVLMAYDEHYANSPVSGSVASLGWTEKAIAETLKTVPPDKLVLGIPLYTRVWSESPDGAGGTAVTSKAIGMADQESLLRGKDPAYAFDDAAGQMTATYLEEGVQKRIWLENEASVKARLRLIEKYKLAGVASWRRGFEAADYWHWVLEVMKGR